MRERVKWASLAAICALLVLSAFSSACARSLITARIVDSETGEPIREAIVAYWWYREKLIVPGMPTKIVTIEAGEEISDYEGAVKMPKYSTLFNDLDMVAYKKGYVCWSNRKTFPGWLDNNDFELENDIVIRLERLTEDYPKKDHAWFFRAMTTGFPQGERLAEAVRIEMRLMRDK